MVRQRERGRLGDGRGREEEAERARRVRQGEASVLHLPVWVRGPNQSGGPL